MTDPTKDPGHITSESVNPRNPDSMDYVCRIPLMNKIGPSTYKIGVLIKSSCNH